MKKNIPFILCFFLLITFSSPEKNLFSFSASFAQCAMCKATATSNIDGKENNVGLGLNKGILYMLAVPFSILLAGGILLHMKNKKKYFHDPV